jgi:hypothetical protein
MTAEGVKIDENCKTGSVIKPPKAIVRTPKLLETVKNPTMVLLRALSS